MRKQTESQKKVRQQHAHFPNCLVSEPESNLLTKKSFQTVVLVEFYTILVRFYQPNVDFISFCSVKSCLFPEFYLPSAFMVDAGMVDSFTQ